jgi:shikimate kinase
MKEKPKNVVVLGFKACGKSTVGRALAGKLKSGFTDLDRAVEKAHTRETGRSMTCREIYSSYGAEHFRELEQRVLKDIVAESRGVIALGGGSLMDAPNPEELLKESLCVYLSVEPEELFSRVMSGGIPAFFDPQEPRASFEELCRQRLPLYLRLADIVADNTGRPAEEVAEEIAAAVDKTALGAGRIR